MSSDRKLSTYEDRKIHKALKGIECNPAELEDAAAHIVRMRMQITPEKLKGSVPILTKTSLWQTVSHSSSFLLTAYVENCAADEQKNARKSSTEVLRATELLERLETMNVDRNHSAYDVALVLKTIANAEELPEPKQLGQIDLRYIYEIRGHIIGLTTSLLLFTEKSTPHCRWWLWVIRWKSWTNTANAFWANVTM